MIRLGRYVTAYRTINRRFIGLKEDTDESGQSTNPFIKRERDYYDLLGCARFSTDAEIKQSFRNLAKIYHPDAPKGNPELFMELQKAYETLSDPEKRRLYNKEQHKVEMKLPETERDKTWITKVYFSQY